ncbi:MAG: hypothetical protein MO853_06700 [Candidatus Protistobacter heckmanni]|nr:hypothetical protein [Candidatus Protistobacter heckmanni]
MDFGLCDSEFAPFFGVQACTLASVSRLARATGAAIVPVTAEMLPVYQGYVLHILPAWTDFPGDTVQSDLRRMNAYFESRILPDPAQYYWVHKRFKTRPDGAPTIY